MDFYNVKTRIGKYGILEVYPDFKVCRSKDLMIRGKKFYAIWDDERGMWSTDEYDVQRIIDQDLTKKMAEEKNNRQDDAAVVIKSMSDYSSKIWKEFKSYVDNLSDNNHQLDQNLCFANTKVTKKDYISRRLPYSVEAGEISAYDELMARLYSPEERAKIEWAIGAVISGDSKDIQKFIVLYGAPGTGKGTVISIIEKLFGPYCTYFRVSDVTSMSCAFALEPFKSNPLVAIDGDAKLNRIEDNTRLNSLVSHEMMSINEKNTAIYSARCNAMLFVATNSPVKITDAKSGIIRRLITVEPIGQKAKIPKKQYDILIHQIEFELGAIAAHCLEVYRQMGKNYYEGYIPLEMIYQTDPFFNYVEAYYLDYKDRPGITLKAAYADYKAYCEESGLTRRHLHQFREELKNYFEHFDEMIRIDGKQVRSWYSGFKTDKFKKPEPGEAKNDHPTWIVLDKKESYLDQYLKDSPAQLATRKETPGKPWDGITTTLKDIDTKKVHYVKPTDPQLVMIDFDLKDDTGQKSAEKNLEAASKWPPTYAEFSKGGAGIHLIYIYDGDVSKLGYVYEPGIEVKCFPGKSSMRRKLTLCNDIPIAHISSGLPLKGDERVINWEGVKDEQHIRSIIEKALRKDIATPYTKPCCDLIFKTLEDAYNSGIEYDLTAMRPKILEFAMKSKNNREYCVSLVSRMHFQSEKERALTEGKYDSDALVFFDIEVFPNLLLVNYKVEGPNQQVIRMINPTPSQVEELFKFKLVGFNCRRYDNHILYACWQGYTNLEMYELSQRIVNGSQNAMFREAYNISYTDVLDFSSVKQSLKKFEIELGIHHQELGLPWDQPVPKERWDEVAAYCDNDVLATEAVFKAREEDWNARQILASLSGLTVNATTNQHTTKIIFGDDPKPQDQFVYTKLSDMFPGYLFENGKSTYRGEVTGEGGYVYAEPGIYGNVALLDVASMHPSSIENLNLFGPYTKNFSDIKQARIAVKHRDTEALSRLLDGTLLKFVGDDKQMDALAYSLKIAINSVYGLTSAKFDNKFRDPRNIDNIVAKRGALFMIDLKHAVQERGFKVAHIKTDSIKIPDATPEIIDFVMRFGQSYGYSFEHEATYDRMCLVNDAVYIARYSKPDICNRLYGYVPKDVAKHPNGWTATGAQFQQPYVFKTLFSKEDILFKDMCETKTVKTALYLDYNEGLAEDEHQYHFVGKAGSFCPIKDGCGGGLLVRENEGKYSSATGAKGYRWMEAEEVTVLGLQNSIDRKYYDRMVDAAVESISKYGDFEWFVDEDPYESDNLPPWVLPCGDTKYDTCTDCPKYSNGVCLLHYNNLK